MTHATRIRCAGRLAYTLGKERVMQSLLKEFRTFVLRGSLVDVPARRCAFCTTELAPAT
ncbi:MAG: hypothetical protein QOD48_1562 [Gaiellaceae bacterium]|nr:hypothetical protein [Gaiellaceae bacterium]